jgi:hypothetical protein
MPNPGAEEVYAVEKKINTRNAIRRFVMRFSLE